MIISVSLGKSVEFSREERYDSFDVPRRDVCRDGEVAIYA